MVSRSDTPALCDQMRGGPANAPLAAVLCAISLLALAAPARAQVLCAAGDYSDDALALQAVAGVQARRAGEPVLWAHEGLCARGELGKHWASLRVSHAFGQAAGSAPGSNDRIEQSARLLPEYRFLLKPLADSGSLRLAALTQYEHDPLRGTAQRLQAGLGPQLQLVDDYRLRFGVGLAYFVGAAKPEPAGGEPAGDWQRRSGAWLSAALGFSVREGVLWSEELLVQLPVEGAGGFAPRGYLQSTFRVRGTRRLSLEAALLLAYDDGVPVELSRWDAVLRAGVVVSL